MLICDAEGMDKTTVLTHLSKQIKQKFPANWVVKFDLNVNADTLTAFNMRKIDR